MIFPKVTVFFSRDGILGIKIPSKRANVKVSGGMNWNEKIKKPLIFQGLLCVTACRRI